MPQQRLKITIGNVAGQSFCNGGLVVSRHATRTGNGTVEHGFFVTRKWLADDDSHWYIIPEAREEEFHAWCKSMEDC